MHEYNGVKHPVMYTSRKLLPHEHNRIAVRCVALRYVALLYLLVEIGINRIIPPSLVYTILMN